MTPEAQRIAIAEACGKRHPNLKWDENGGYFTTDPVGNVYGGYPEYLNDLNAMREAEKTLLDIQRVVYLNTLALLCGGAKFDDGLTFVEFSSAVSATAAQRAEAFLRTKGLWK